MGLLAIRNFYIPVTCLSVAARVMLHLLHQPVLERSAFFCGRYAAHAN